VELEVEEDGDGGGGLNEACAEGETSEEGDRLAGVWLVVRWKEDSGL
jgi:hypothetical protein